LERLRERRQYQAVGRGVRVARPGLILQAAPQSAEDAAPRFGFTVTKKTGGSVERNRIRRRLKEAVRRAGEAASRGVDYVVIGALARVIHGTPEITDELDVVPSLKERNLQRLAKALAELAPESGA